MQIQEVFCGPGVRDAGVGKPQCENIFYKHPVATPTPTQPDTNVPNELAKNILFLPVCYRLLFMTSTTPLKIPTQLVSFKVLVIGVLSLKPQ